MMLSDIRMVMLSTLTAFGILAGALKPDCAPGGNFDLQKWDLQLPVGTSENPGSPRTLRSGELSGCEGWSDPDYFFTSKKDGRLITKVRTNIELSIGEMRLTTNDSGSRIS